MSSSKISLKVNQSVILIQIGKCKCQVYLEMIPESQSRVIAGTPSLLKVDTVTRAQCHSLMESGSNKNRSNNGGMGSTNTTTTATTSPTTPADWFTFNDIFGEDIPPTIIMLPLVDCYCLHVAFDWLVSACGSNSTRVQTRSLLKTIEMR